MAATQTSWHEAITCAIQIDLRDYSKILKYETEHFLSRNKNRIDFLIIKKQSNIHIPKSIASIFHTHNIFEIKGLHSTLTTNAYYKTNGHAGYYINSYTGNTSLTRRDISLSFLSFQYPRKLFRHLTKECNKAIAKTFPGVYYILNEMYPTQVLVINELAPEDTLYLACLSQQVQQTEFITTLTNDCISHKDTAVYTKYMNQFFNFHTKGDKAMVCEGVLRYFGTSSEEIAEQTREQDRKIYLPQIEKLTEEKNSLISENQTLKQLLQQYNIAY